MWLFTKESLLNTEKWAFARLTIEFSSFCLDKFQKKIIPWKNLAEMAWVVKMLINNLVNNIFMWEH